MVVVKRFSNMIPVVATFIIINIIPVVSQNCTFGNKDIPKFVNETDPAGTVLFTSSKPVTENVTLNISQDQTTNKAARDELETCFELWQNATHVVISLTKPLDLEYYRDNFGGEDITSVALEIYCSGKNDVRIAVQPVNEYPPVFENAPYTITIPESTSVGEAVFDFKSRVTDQDFGSINFYISLEPYRGNSADGRSHFVIPQMTRGELKLNGTVDYDAVNSIKRFAVNVSVQDDGRSLSSHTVLVINIEDVDDQVPYFLSPGCTNPCLVPQFEAITDLHHTGVLQTQPVALQGHDDDTLGTTLLYSISAGNQHNLFTMNEQTAVVTQRVSVSSSNLPDVSFRLIIEVRKNLTIDLSSKAILVINVKKRKQNDTSSPVEVKSTDSLGLLIPLIILAVLSGVIIIAFIVVIVVYRKNNKTMAVVPDKNRNKKFINNESASFTKNTHNGKATPAENETDNTKRRKKKRKTRKGLKKSDDTGFVQNVETTTKNQTPLPDYLVNGRPLPTPRSFNQSQPLPKIGNGVTTVNGSSGVNTKEMDKEKGGAMYPTLTDAFQSEPPAWHSFRDNSVVFNTE